MKQTPKQIIIAIVGTISFFISVISFTLAIIFYPDQFLNKTFVLSSAIFITCLLIDAEKDISDNKTEN